MYYNYNVALWQPCKRALDLFTAEFIKI